MTLVAGSGGEAVLHRHTVALLHITNTLCKTNVWLSMLGTNISSLYRSWLLNRRQIEYIQSRSLRRNRATV